jgi:hypothetical protein
MSRDHLDGLLGALSRLHAAHANAGAAAEEIRTLLSAMFGLPATRQLRAGSPRTAHYPALPFADRDAFAVLWREKACHLGNTVTFRVFEQLSRRPDRYVSVDALLREAWRGDVRSKHTVRSVVRHLRSKLRAAHMSDLADAIHGLAGSYGLILGATR